MTDCFNDFIAPKFGKNPNFSYFAYIPAINKITYYFSIVFGWQHSCKTRYTLPPDSPSLDYFFSSQKIISPSRILNTSSHISLLFINFSKFFFNFYVVFQIIEYFFICY